MKHIHKCESWLGNFIQHQVMEELDMNEDLCHRSESNFRNIGNELYAKLESMNEQRLGTTDDFELLLQNLCHTSVCLVIPVAT